jgi:hypothetical protein
MGCGGELSRFGNRPGLIVVGQFSLSRPVGRLFALSQFGLFSFLSKGCASQEWEISLWKVVEKGSWLGWVVSRHLGPAAAPVLRDLREGEGLADEHRQCSLKALARTEKRRSNRFYRRRGPKRKS